VDTGALLGVISREIRAEQEPTRLEALRWWEGGGGLGREGCRGRGSAGDEGGVGERRLGVHGLTHVVGVRGRGYCWRETDGAHRCKRHTCSSEPRSEAPGGALMRAPCGRRQRHW
jgi:hypothetical protein